MATDTYNVRFIESGAVVIKRKFDDIGRSADRATRGIFLLQRALFVLGGAGIVRAIVGFSDALTNLENKLRLTSSSTANLEKVQDALFRSANRSRSSIESTATIYSRVALSARALGVSQQQVIDVTETLQKAAIVSGAGAQEANAALIQLGQGLAAGRLNGDELRSVLEQLPFVADLIVDYLNDIGTFGTVTRGNLRQLGADGKLTSEIVFNAIAAAQEGVAKIFDETNPTIEQAFAIGRNNLLKFIDDFDDATGASTKLANAIIKVTENLGALITVAQGAVLLLGLSFGAKLVAAVLAYQASITKTGAAVARFFAIQTAGAAKQAAVTATTVADTRARLLNINARQVQIASTLASSRAEFAEAQAAFQNGRARSAQTGQFIGLQAARDRLTAATIRLTAAENAQRIAAGRSSALTTQLIIAENAQTVAKDRLATATAAQSGFIGRLAARFPFLTGVIRIATGALVVFTGVLAANPVGALVTAIALITFGIIKFGDQIKITNDGLVNLKNFSVAAFELLGEFIQPAIDKVADFASKIRGLNVNFGNLRDFAGRAILGLLAIIIDTFTLIPRVIIGVVAGIIASFDQLPLLAGSALDALVGKFLSAFEAIANIGIGAFNSIKGAINSLGGAALEKLGFERLEPTDLADFSRFQTTFGGAGNTAGEAFSTAFNGVVENNTARNLADAIIDRARFNELNDRSDRQLIDSIDPVTTIPGEPTLGIDESGAGKKGAGGADVKTFAEEIAALEKRIELEKEFGLQKEITNNVQRIEETIKRSLSQTEKDQVASLVALIEISKEYSSILEGIEGPQQRLEIGQQALNLLFDQGAISLENYNTKLRELQINADLASGTLGGGFKAAIAGSIQSATQFGEALGGVVVNAATSAADAIVEFAKTGKFEIRAFFADLFAQLLKLAAQQILLGFIGSFLGIPPGFGGGFGGGAVGGLLGFSQGGSILPNGPGSTDTQIVSFKKRPDERVDILTPQQQAAQRNNGGGGGGQTVVQSPPVNVAAVLSPSDIVRAFDNSDGEIVVINILQRNPGVVRAITGG